MIVPAVVLPNIKTIMQQVCKTALPLIVKTAVPPDANRKAYRISSGSMIGLSQIPHFFWLAAIAPGTAGNVETD